MIPKASQRGLGQDLATHLQNAYDNEYVEIAEVRGAVACDLHGAFAEWEVCAHAMTGCRNYLYSLSVNPDPAQRQLTRTEYRDYIDRASSASPGSHGRSSFISRTDASTATSSGRASTPHTARPSTSPSTARN
jgi:hypothetical protein